MVHGHGQGGKAGGVGHGRHPERLKERGGRKDTSLPFSPVAGEKTRRRGDFCVISRAALSMERISQK